MVDYLDVKESQLGEILIAYTSVSSNVLLLDSTANIVYCVDLLTAIEAGTTSGSILWQVQPKDEDGSLITYEHTAVGVNYTGVSSYFYVAFNDSNGNGIIRRYTLDSNATPTKFPDNNWYWSVAYILDSLPYVSESGTHITLYAYVRNPKNKRIRIYDGSVNYTWNSRDDDLYPNAWQIGGGATDYVSLAGETNAANLVHTHGMDHSEYQRVVRLPNNEVPMGLVLAKSTPTSNYYFYIGSKEHKIYQCRVDRVGWCKLAQGIGSCDGNINYPCLNLYKYCNSSTYSILSEASWNTAVKTTNQDYRMVVLYNRQLHWINIECVNLGNTIENSTRAVIDVRYDENEDDIGTITAFSVGNAPPSSYVTSFLVGTEGKKIHQYDLDGVPSGNFSTTKSIIGVASMEDYDVGGYYVAYSTENDHNIYRINKSTKVEDSFPIVYPDGTENTNFKPVTIGTSHVGGNSCVATATGTRLAVVWHSRYADVTNNLKGRFHQMAPISDTLTSLFGFSEHIIYAANNIGKVLKFVHQNYGLHVLSYIKGYWVYGCTVGVHINDKNTTHLATRWGTDEIDFDLLTWDENRSQFLTVKSYESEYPAICGFSRRSGDWYLVADLVGSLGYKSLRGICVSGNNVWVTVYAGLHEHVPGELCRMWTVSRFVYGSWSSPASSFTIHSYTDNFNFSTGTCPVEIVNNVLFFCGVKKVPGYAPALASYTTTGTQLTNSTASYYFEDLAYDGSTLWAITGIGEVYSITSEGYATKLLSLSPFFDGACGLAFVKVGDKTEAEWERTELLDFGQTPIKAVSWHPGTSIGETKRSCTCPYPKAMAKASTEF